MKFFPGPLLPLGLAILAWASGREPVMATTPGRKS